MKNIKNKELSKKVKDLKKDKDKEFKDKLKLQEVISYLFDNVSAYEKMPDRIINRKGDLNSLFFKIPKVFYFQPLLVIQINKINSLYSNIKDLELLKYYKVIIQMNNLNINAVYNVRWIPNTKNKFVERYLELSQEYQRSDITSLYYLNEFMKGFGGNLNISNLEPDVQGKGNSSPQLNEKLEEALKYNQAQKIKNDVRFLSFIDQQVIDDEELAIFDVKLLRKSNEVLFIFLDKNSQKRYYKEPLKYDFIWSVNEFVFENDYITKYDDSKHVKFSITNMNDIYKIKKAIDSNFDNAVRLKN